jgi:drug/metabolite transporter (DMT)-like permease
MDILFYGALLLAQAGITAKQFAMKKCGQIASGPFNSVCINLMRSAICLVVSVIIWLMTDGGTTTAFGHFIIIISGIGTALNLFTWILSTRLVSLILIESVTMIGSLVLPLVLAPVLYNGDSVSLVQWIGCILIFVSVFLFVNKGNGEKKEGSVLKKIVVVAFCALGATVAALFKKYYTYHISDKGLGSIEYFTLMNFVTVLFFFVILFTVYYLLEKKRISGVEGGGKVELPYKKVFVYIMIAATALYVAELFSVYAAQLPSAIYYPLSKGLAVLATFLLDVIVFKDKVTVKKIIGLCLVIIAIVLVNL